METLLLLLSLLDDLSTKITDTSRYKAELEFSAKELEWNTKLQQTKILASRDKYIAAILVLGGFSAFAYTQSRIKKQKQNKEVDHNDEHHE